MYNPFGDKKENAKRVERLKFRLCDLAGGGFDLPVEIKNNLRLATDEVKHQAVLSLIDQGAKLDELSWDLSNGKTRLLHVASGIGYQFDLEFENNEVRYRAVPIHQPKEPK